LAADGVATVAEVVRRAEDDPDRLLVFVGCTASGKSALALEVAERIAGGGEIIGADSVQIYKYFDCGSGKPNAEERSRAPHHLVDVASPLEPFDAARYVEAADRAIGDVRARGKRPIVCGGTFLWVKALTQGLAAAPPGDAKRREAYATFVQRNGVAALHDRLRAVDAVAAARLHPNDVLRVGRALEVFETSGRPMSEWHAEHGFAAARHPAWLLAPEMDGSALDRRIEARVAAFLASGWIDEVRRLVESGFGQARAMGSVGYREVKEHLDGQLPESELSIKIIRATRVYARRQRTWLRDVPLTRVSRS
jgi:tRNA dimethylallyltransferase